MISSGAHAECLRLLELLTNKRVQESWSWVFMTPVQIPGYQDVIKKPMDLGTVKKNLGSKPSRCRFKSHEKFAKDVRLVFQNALLYNKDDEHVKGSVYDAAQHLLRVFETAYAKSQESVFKKEDSYEMPQEQESTGLSGVESSSKQLDVFDDVKKKLKKSKKKSKSSDPADVQSSAVNTEPSMEDKFPTEADKKLSTKAVETMSEENISACLDILMKLIKYKEGNISPAAPFLQPVDLNHFPDYKIKIPHRMHLYGVQKKLKNGGYADFDAFAHDVRLIFSNCLVYNSDVLLSKTIRNHAVTLMKLFEAQFSKIGGSWKGIPDRWKCHHILQEILAVRVDGLEVAQWFKYPIQTYFDSSNQVPYGYFQKIKHPMDLGTVSSKLHTGGYRHVHEFLRDTKLVFDNCLKYWKNDPHGQAYCDSAKTLIGLLKTHALSNFGANETELAFQKNRSKAKTMAESEDDKGKKKKALSDKDLCLKILRLLKTHKMKGYGEMEILTAGPFLHAVDTTKYPDYLKIVSEPMDFAKIERKLKGDRYSNVDEFSADVHLVFLNCMKYNSDPVEGADIRAMASSLQTYFVSLYEQELTGQKRSNAEVKKLPSPMKSKSSSSVTLPSSGALNILAEKSNERGDFIGPDQKKRKKDKKEKKDKREKKKKKDKKKEKKKEKHESLDNNIIQALPVPISSTTLSIETTTSASALVASKTLPPAAVRFAVGVETGKRKKMKKATDLSGWEASAERVLNRMQRIESVSKLHFDRPLLKTFPELSTDYKALVSEPMDLGTLRELLHNHSLIPSEFVTKGKLIFKNALAFNIGEDSASIHVREMADHLLWYFESLCSEQNLLEDAELSKRPTIRQERADLVSTLSMEMKSKECQKLIRVLNSQKYDKICWPFRKPVKVLFPSIPSDYFEIIKSPMDLATIGDKLIALDYKNYGEFIQDVRLTFENALLYNKADKDKEGWSVYSAAKELLKVVEDLWADASLEITERARRREVLRKERERAQQKRRQEEIALEKDKERKWMEEHERRMQEQKVQEALVEQKMEEDLEKSSFRAQQIDTGANRKLQLTIKQNMNKSERKAEEKRRKRARREEEIARSEKRRRTAVAATDDALREAEMRSRRRIQKLEIVAAIRLREARESKSKEEESRRELLTKVKFDPSKWNGKLRVAGLSKLLWLRKHRKMQIDVPDFFKSIEG